MILSISGFIVSNNCRVTYTYFCKCTYMSTMFGTFNVWWWNILFLIGLYTWKLCVCVSVERVKHCSIFKLSRTTIFCSIYLFFCLIFVCLGENKTPRQHYICACVKEFKKRVDIYVECCHMYIFHQDKKLSIEKKLLKKKGISNKKLLFVIIQRWNSF